MKKWIVLVYALLCCAFCAERVCDLFGHPENMACQYDDKGDKEADEKKDKDESKKIISAGIPVNEIPVPFTTHIYCSATALPHPGFFEIPLPPPDRRG